MSDPTSAPIGGQSEEKNEVTNFVQAQITRANRAPNSRDGGYFWVHDKGSTNDLYVRCGNGTWVKH